MDATNYSRIPRIPLWNVESVVYDLLQVRHLPCLKLTLPLKIGLSKKNMVFQTSIFRCYISFREGRRNTSECLWDFWTLMILKCPNHNCLSETAMVKNLLKHSCQQVRGWKLQRWQKDKHQIGKVKTPIPVNRNLRIWVDDLWYFVRL